MKITFRNNNLSNLFKKMPQEQRLETIRKDLRQETQCLTLGLASGLASGAITAAVMTYKKQSPKFVYSLSVGSAMALLTYMVSLLYSTVKNIKNNQN